MLQVYRGIAALGFSITLLSEMGIEQYLGETISAHSTTGGKRHVVDLWILHWVDRDTERLAYFDVYGCESISTSLLLMWSRK